MKHVAALAVLGIILSFTFCTEDSNNPRFIPGYISPGDFRPTGVATEKQYHFNHASFDQDCGPATLPPDDPGLPGGQECAAVYGNWFTAEENIYAEGIAVNDRHLATPVFSMKIFRAIGSPWWYATIILNGASHSGVITDPGAISVTRLKSQNIYSQDFTTPQYGSLSSSGGNINLTVITFNNNIDIGGVRIQAGEKIVAQDHAF